MELLTVDGFQLGNKFRISIRFRTDVCRWLLDKLLEKSSVGSGILVSDRATFLVKFRTMKNRNNHRELLANEFQKRIRIFLG